MAPKDARLEERQLDQVGKGKEDMSGYGMFKRPSGSIYEGRRGRCWFTAGSLRAENSADADADAPVTATRERRQEIPK